MNKVAHLALLVTAVALLIFTCANVLIAESVVPFPIFPFWHNGYISLMGGVCAVAAVLEIVTFGYFSLTFAFLFGTIAFAVFYDPIWISAAYPLLQSSRINLLICAFIFGLGAMQMLYKYELWYKKVIYDS